MFLKSLDRKILVVLSFSVALVIVFIIYFTNRRLTQEILDEFRSDSKESMTIVASGMRQTMASGNGRLIEKQLLDIKAENANIELFVADTNQKITFSSEIKSLNKFLQDELFGKQIREDLTRGFQTGEIPDELYEEKVEEKRFFMHAHLMHNQAECFRCHGSDKKILGAIILRKPVDWKYASLAELRNANIAISLLGVLAIIILSHFLVTRLISRPIRTLALEIAELPERIADNSIVGKSRVSRDDEIGDLQKAFHYMAIDLYEKNHAIQRVNSDLADANKELESFAYSVSHDLRAPLRNIDGFSKILMDEFSEALPDKAKHYLTRVRNGTNRMSMLIDDILAFSRIGRTDIEFKKMPCAAIVKSVLENFAEEIEQRNVAVTVGDLPVINCGPVLMQSLFLNLISNALKFTRNTEKPEITIGFDEMRRLIFVRDNGLGFDMKYHDKIFQIFQRLYLPEEFEGTGIGLSIVKRIAERHHGKVWAESEPGRGATFFLDLPTF
jgi:signal transduction histidine kinase